jgi:hypothetical protein
MNRLHKIFIILFFGSIYFPLVDHLIPIVKPVTSNENRALAGFPEPDTCDIDKIPLYLENYLVDRLGTRNNMIRFYNQLNIFVFKSSPSGIKAFIGKNNWLFFSGEELRTYTGTELFKENELEEFKTEMLRRQKIIASYNARLLIAIVPNKATIYPEYMPEHLVKSDHYGYGRQMHQYLKKNGLPVVDLYTALEQSKGACDLYFKTDNHWNDLGAFVACNSIVRELKLDLPGLELLDTSEYPIRPSKESAGDVAKMLSIEDETTDMNYSPTPAKGYKSKLNDQKKYEVIKDFPYPSEYEQVYIQSDTTLPNILLIRDSFGKRLIPYLAERSRNCTAIFDSWHYGLNEAIIKDSKPDVVIYLILESQLKNVMKFQKAKVNE